MLEKRVIPVLLLDKGKLVKTVQFKDGKYVGDPINTVKIFNDKEADELLVLDISRSRDGLKPDMQLLREMASEAFMPMAYGGGLRDLETVEAVLKLGYEKVTFNTAAYEDQNLIKEAVRLFGSQSVVCSIDVGQTFFGNKPVCYSHVRRKNLSESPVAWARKLEELGAGEILLNSVNRDGMCEGYDIELIREVAAQVSVPLVALGGAWKQEHLVAVLKAGASAAAAGSMFVYHGTHKAVLVNYPKRKELENVFQQAKN